MREELWAGLPDYYHPPFDTTSPDFSLKEAIRNEFRDGLSDFPKLSSGESRNAAPSDGVTTLCEFRQQTPNAVPSYSDPAA